MAKFGQYELLDRIAVGGMAEIFRGRAMGEEGFEKPVAIKRILPSYARDNRFVSMLVTEARIHASLSHRNIVQIHDLGISEDGEYFIVLEYVDGPDLAHLLGRLGHDSVGTEVRRRRRLPDPVALYVAIELGEGVHFAHDLAGPDGQPLALVHRDISPSNVLLSYAGEVKLSDFGLAKRRTDHSVVGSLKGKLAYMSPEQARRAPLDRRSDIFALGAVLFEMLTGHPLRDIADDVSGWQQVASGLVPPARRFRTDMPPALDRLLAGALAPDPRDRFADALAFVTAARAALDLLPRSREGEAGELQALMKETLPPGSPRPPKAPSKVIRLMSEFVALEPKEALSARSLLGARAAAGRPPAATTAVTTIAPRPTPPDPEEELTTQMSAPPRAAMRTTPAGAMPAAARRTPSAPLPTVRRTPAAPLAATGALPGGVVRRTPSGPMPSPPGAVAMGAARKTPSGPLPSSRSGPGLPPPQGGRPTPAAPMVAAARPSSPYPTAENAAHPSSSYPAIDRGPREAGPGRGRPVLAPLVLLFAAGAVGVAAFVHFLFVPLQVLAVWSDPARFEIRSEPNGAEVFLDGVRLSAVTPTYTEIHRDRSSHLVEVRKDGFRPVQQRIRYDHEARLEVAVTLERRARPGVEPLPPPPGAAPAVPAAGPAAAGVAPAVPAAVRATEAASGAAPPPASRRDTAR